MGATVGDDVSEAVQPANGEACRPGETLSGRYRIVRFIARGATGAVYEADDLVVGTTVAIKVLHAERASSSTAIERLHRELALARRITHRNVCRLHDVGEDAGRIFLTMELLDGETLAARIARGPIDAAELDAIAEQLVAALEAAHTNGVVHRDFKPQNVILVDDRVVVTDFGLARSTSAGDDAISLTGDTAMIGTPAYMAPEQVEGRDVTIASDIYALGIVLYELATGAPPFREGTALATATARLHRDPPRIARADLDPRWIAAIVRCLQRDPSARFASVREILDARRARKQRSSLAAIVVVVAFAAIVAAVVVASGGKPTYRTIAAPSFFPSHVRPSSTKAAVMFDRANAALAAGDRVAAREALEVAVSNAPEDPIAQAGLAELLAALGYRERAEEANRRAMRSIERLVDEPRAYVLAVDAIVGHDTTTGTEAAQKDSAVTALERLVVLAPTEPAYRIRLAKAHLAAKKPELAATALAGLLLPPLDDALLEATIADARGDSTVALAAAVRAETLSPPDTRANEHAMALVLAGNARWRLDDGDAAKRDYLRAIELGDTGTRVEARRQLVELESSSDDLLGSANRLKEQAALLRTLGNRVYLADVLMDGASLFAEIGHFDDAEAMIAEARMHAIALDSKLDIAWIDALEARMASWRGQLERARTLAERAYGESRTLNQPGIQGNSFYTWTVVLLEYDDPVELARMRALRTETIERLIDCVAAFREGDLDRAERIGQALANLTTYEGRIAAVIVAQVAIRRDKLDGLEERLSQIEAHLQGDTKSIVVRERLVQARAMLLAKRKRVTEALALLDGYIDTCAAVGLGLPEVRTRGVAAILALEGYAKDANQRVDAALARANELGMKRTTREVREAYTRSLVHAPN